MREVVDLNFERQMENWRNTVRFGCGGNGGGCCAGWAAKYVAARNKQEELLALELEIIKPGTVLYAADVDELNGWLVESAVRSIPYFEQVQVLRFHHVFQYPNHFIKNKLRVHNPRINDSSLRILLGRAESNLKNILEKLQSPAKIRSYNLHARCVPRPMAKPVPVGTAAPSES